MKKIANIFILSISIIIFFVACSKSLSVEDSFDMLITGYKNYDAEILDKYSIGNTFKIISDGQSDLDKEYMKTIFSNLTYKIKSVETNKNESIVTVEIKNKDLSKMLSSKELEDFSESMYENYDSYGNEKAQKLINDFVKIYIENSNLNYYTTTVSIKSKKQNGIWKFDIQGNDEFIDAIIGNMLNKKDTLK